MFAIPQDVLTKLNLFFAGCRGHCYDGAASVSGEFTDLQKRVRDVEPQAVFVHCQAHSLNLVAQAANTSIASFQDILNDIGDIINFVRESPKRLSWFQSIQKQYDDDKSTTALRPLCPTRRPLLSVAIKCILSNYDE